MNRTQHRIYFDHAATTAVRPEVADVIYDVMKHVYGNPSSLYKEGHEAAHLVADARARLADILNCAPNELYFTSCGTESDNWAIKGTAFKLAGKGKHLITSKIEHHAILHSMEWLKTQGFDITYLDVDELGRVNPQDVAAAIREDTILVSIMMANNEVGTIQPVEEIARICHEKQVLFHCDAVQAFGAIPIDVKKLGVDMMSFSGHKLGTPKGIGLMYMRRGVRIDNLIHGGAQEYGKRAGTENVPYIAGLAKAAEMAMAEMPEKTARLTELREYLVKELLSKIPHSRYNGDPVHRLPNNMNFSFEFIEGESILLMLDALGYDTSSGSACASSDLKPSHVLLAIGLPAEIAHGSIRITLGSDNTKEDIEALAKDLPEIIERLRQMSPLWEAFQKGEIENCLIP